MTDARVLGIVADIGGTHARFALAVLSRDGLVSLDQQKVFHTADYPSLEAAFAAFAGGLAEKPRRAAFAVAAPLAADEVKLTNSAWRFRQSALQASLGLERVTLINDFAAIAHALPLCPQSDFQSLTGAAFALPQAGAISIVGPGTGLGVGLLLRRGGEDIVLPSEGGHIGFAPPDAEAIALLQKLLGKQQRLSAERVLCGDGLSYFHQALGGTAEDPLTLWDAAISGRDPLAVAALERWLYLLGMFAGDIALAHGAAGVVMAGGILPRLGARLNAPLFMQGFCSKGRFAEAMARLPVAMLRTAQPGLLGAAAVLKNN